MAYGYPLESMGYYNASGTAVGLNDCLGCTAWDAGFKKEDVLVGGAEVVTATIAAAAT